MFSTLARSPLGQRLSLHAAGRLWEAVKAFFSSAREPAQAPSGVSSTDDRQLGRIQMQLAQAAADYKAAKQIWPRDREAIARTWRQFRAARCAQISAEIGR